MTIGGSIFLLAVGAILAFAVTTSIAGISLTVAGYILMAAGALGLLLALFMGFGRPADRADVVRRERTVREP